MTGVRMVLGVSMRFLVLLAALTSVQPAAASGGLWCQLEDQQVRISIDSGVTHGMGGPVFNFRGKLEILAKSVAEELRVIEFDRDTLTQYWLDGHELKLHLYQEWQDDKPFRSVNLVIETQAGDEDSPYAGSYSLDLFDNGAADDRKETKLSGTINCGAE
jgi:hypothetical protein